MSGGWEGDRVSVGGAAAAVGVKGWGWPAALGGCCCCWWWADCPSLWRLVLLLPH